MNNFIITAAGIALLSIAVLAIAFTIVLLKRSRVFLRTKREGQSYIDYKTFYFYNNATRKELEELKSKTDALYNTGWGKISIRNMEKRIDNYEKQIQEIQSEIELIKEKP